MAVYMLAIHGFVPAFVGLYHGAVQAYPSENTFGARIGENLCFHFSVRVCSGMPAHWPGRYRGVGSDLEFVAEQALQSVIVHKEHYQVGGRAPDLITHAPALNRQKHWGAPAMLGATGCQPPAVIAAEYECELHVTWNDGDTLHRFQ